MTSKSPRIGCIAFSAVAGVLGGVLSILVIIAIRNRDSTPDLTRADFETAQDLWTKSGPVSYRIEVKVVGPQPATYRVEVQQGQVAWATIDGRPLKNQRTFDTWSVPGMFGTMERDVAHVEDWASGRATRGTPRLTLLALFDPTYGYPQRYRRIEWGANRDMTWEVQEFTVIEE